MPGFHTVTSISNRSNTSPSLGAWVRSWFSGNGSAVATDRIVLVPPPSKAAALREAWCQASVAGGWLTVTDWWDPACDAVIDCLVDGQDPAPALQRLGIARAELGCSVEETIDDVLALWQAYEGRAPTLDRVRCLLSGWAEAGLKPVGADTCVDPISMLATRAYLEARLAELYRDGRPSHPSDRFNLIVVDVATGDGFTGVGAMARVAESLRRVCTNGETLAGLAPGRAVALVESGPDLADQLAELEGLLATPELVDMLCATIWVESLPRTYPFVQGLLIDLSR